MPSTPPARTTSLAVMLVIALPDAIGPRMTMRQP